VSAGAIVSKPARDIDRCDHVDAVDERQPAGNPRRAGGASHDLAAARLQPRQVLVQVAELEQRNGSVGAVDALLELLDGQPPVEVMRAEQIDDRAAVAVSGTQLRVRHGGERTRRDRVVTSAPRAQNYLATTGSPCFAAARAASIAWRAKTANPGRGLPAGVSSAESQSRLSASPRQW
jgi:hypothetical protein